MCRGDEASREVDGCEVRFLRVPGLWEELAGEAVVGHRAGGRARPGA